MISPTSGFALLFIYATLVFLVAQWAEARAASGRNIGNNPWVYSLSFTVWMSAWSFYGHVGTAATTGALYLTSHLGTTLTILLWWVLLRKMVRVRHVFRITSIADFLSLRYDKSASIAALATLIATVGTIPYAALQMKAVISTFTYVVRCPESGSTPLGEHVGLGIAVFMILFTIVFGVRRLVPTERHQGLVFAMAVEGCMKLVSFLAAGIFIVFFLFHGFDDVFRQYAASPMASSAFRPAGTLTFPWVTRLVVVMAAVAFVPAMFHIMVVENFHERHIRTAIWVCPLCLLLINLFILPVAMAGLLLRPQDPADSYVLTLPFNAGHTWLTLFVFLGGISAAMGMLVVNAMALSTMFTNHLLLPVLESVRSLSFLRRYLLQCRWVAVAGIILASYWFERRVGQYSMLAEVGHMTFTAILQLAPAMIGGMFWRRGNRMGATLGMSAGFVTWAYCLVLPAFAKEGWIPRSFLDEGPWNLAFLRPEHLFGFSGVDAASWAVFCSLAFNLIFYVVGSLLWEQGAEERAIAETFVRALEAPKVEIRADRSERIINSQEKCLRMEEVCRQYFAPAHASLLVSRCLLALKLEERSHLSVMELAELTSEVEKCLASSIGAAAAHQALQEAGLFSPEEESHLKQAYTDIITELRLPPSELVQKIDYYRERERLLASQAHEMEAMLHDRDREIEERTRAEEALAEQKERLAVTLRSIGDGVITTDTRGDVVLLNRVAEELTGWPQEEASGRPLSEVFQVFSGKTRQRLDDPVARVLDTDSVIGVQSRAVLVSRNGSEHIIADSGAPIRDRESRVIGVVLVFRDVTEKESLEQELLRAQKIESVGVLAGGIAHDFNNLLTAILGNISLLKAETRQQGGNRRLDGAERACLRARDLTQQLLTFARGGAPVRKSQSLAQVIEESAAFALRGANTMCEFAIAQDLWPALVDAGQISQVIHNMVLNADQAMPDGGVVQVTARNELVKGGYPLPLGPGRYVLISIRDTGVGLAPEHLDRIFDPYFTTKQSGTGLGLASSYSIIRKHEGHISVESSVGGGTTFHIYLPAAPEAAAENQESDRPALQEARGRVLLMDDDDLVLEVAGSLLGHLGFEVECARDGTAAVEMYRSAMGSPRAFDIVLVDLTIRAGMGGKEAITHLRAMDPHVRAVVSSGYSTDPIMADFRSHGFCGVVTKPYTAETLAKVMHQVLQPPAVEGA